MDFVTIAERIGIPTAILVIFAFAVWRVLKWMGTTVIKPMADSHIAFVNETTQTNKVNSQTLERLTQILEANTGGVQHLMDHGCANVQKPRG